MSRRRILPTVFALLVPFLATAQQPAASASLPRHPARMQRQIASLRGVARRQDERLIALDERGAGPRAAGDTGSRPLASARGIYGKPFVRRFGSGTAVGGYASTEFRSEYVNELHARRSVFDAHRVVPFIFSDITDRLHFGTEIEFAHATRLHVAHTEPPAPVELNL